MTTAEDWGEGYRVSIVFFIIVKMLNCGIYVYVYYICAIYIYIYIKIQCIYTHVSEKAAQPILFRS